MGAAGSGRQWLLERRPAGINRRTEAEEDVRFPLIGMVEGAAELMEGAQQARAAPAATRPLEPLDVRFVTRSLPFASYRWIGARATMSQAAEYSLRLVGRGAKAVWFFYAVGALLWRRESFVRRRVWNWRQNAQQRFELIRR